MASSLALIIAAGSFVISAATVWLTLLRSGKIRMTRPTMLFLGPDGCNYDVLKVLLRTFLYSTGKRGKLIENMYVIVSRADMNQTFSTWIYSEDGRLQRGSGLRIDEEGKALDHHFLLPPECSGFQFASGGYSINVYAKLVGERHSRLLHVISVDIPEAVAKQAKRYKGGAVFDWDPEQNQYSARIRPAIIDNQKPITDDQVPWSVQTSNQGPWSVQTSFYPRDFIQEQLGHAAQRGDALAKRPRRPRR